MPRFSPLVVKLFAGAALAGLVAIAACTGVEGVTPTCTANVGGNGIVPSADGCEQFAACHDKDGGAQDPHLCCVDSKGMALTGCDLYVCLYSYGTQPDKSLCPDMMTSSSSSSGGGDAGP
jgi:hypothetical protein